MEIALLIIIAALLVGIALYALQLNAKLANLNKPADEGAQKLMLEVIENLRRDVNNNVSNSTGENRKDMARMAELLEQQFNNLNKSVDSKIGENTRMLGERLDNAAKVIAQTKVELGKMTEIRGSIDSLTNFLKHGKRRGNLGEEGLKEMLAEALPKDKWHLQYAFRGGDTVDAVIETKNGIIPVDSKFPLENFEKMQQAEQPALVESARKEFVKDVKKHIDSISKKYIRPDEGTTDFAVMYVPAESIHYEAAILNDELNTYARSRRVHMVSPNGLFYFLRVILIAFQSQKFEENAKQVLSLIAGVKQESVKFGEGLELTAKHLNNAKKNMDETVSGYQKLESRIDRVSELSIGEVSAKIDEKGAGWDVAGKLPI